jgi:hypothetical protein
MKYNEDKIIEEIAKYVGSTYNQHYVGSNQVQTIDVWEALGSVESSLRDNAIKYLMRFGKKDGKNRKDLLKTIHYVILLMHFAFLEEKNDKDRLS